MGAQLSEKTKPTNLCSQLLCVSPTTTSYTNKHQKHMNSREQKTSQFFNHFFFLYTLTLQFETELSKVLKSMQHKAKLSTALNVFLRVCFATLVRTDNPTDTSLLSDSPHPLVCLPHPTHCISQTALMRMCAKKGFAISQNPQTIIIARQQCSELLLTESHLIFCQSSGRTF